MGPTLTGTVSGGARRARGDRRLNILVSAFCCDAYDVSEDLDGFHWVRELSRHCDVTLFTLGRPGRKCGTEDMPHVKTHLYPQTWLGRRYPSLERTLLPSYLPFSLFSLRRARAAMRQERFDLVHQITPAALRFPSGMAALGLPFILGPVGGGVDLPKAFAGEVDDEPVYFRLRCLDRLRMRVDPTLVYTLSKASRILVQGEYAVDMLPARVRDRCEVMLGAGLDELPRLEPSQSNPDELRVLYVGRVVATKGLRYVLRALGRLKGRVNWRLTVVGDGPDMDTVNRIAGEIEAGDRVTFVGRVPHEEVGQYYAKADVFAFPSLKEAGGNVVLEAMSYGVPAIVCDHGGPATTVTPDCGFKIKPESTECLISGIATALEACAASSDLRRRMGAAARARVAAEYLWDTKGQRMLWIYNEVLAEAEERRRFNG